MQWFEFEKELGLFEVLTLGPCVWYAEGECGLG